MDLGIKNKVALVTGGGGGLGGAIATSLAKEGARVIVADIDLEAAQGITKQLTNQGLDAMPIKWDLFDIEGIEGYLEEVTGHWGGVDILINNTGGPRPSLVENVPVEEWRAYFDSMVVSIIKLTDAVLPYMRELGWGRIITSTSSGVIAPIPNLGLSNALRGTLLGWSKTLSQEVAGYGITANVILPGRIATQRIRALDKAKAERENRSIEEVGKESVNSIPVGRYGEPHEYGGVVAFLASQQASYITGSVIRVDGGLIKSI